MPFIHAAAQDPSLARDAQEGKLSKTQVFEAVSKFGGVSFTHNMAGSYYDKCLGIMDKLALTGRRKEILAGLLERAYKGLK